MMPSSSDLPIDDGAAAPAAASRTRRVPFQRLATAALFAFAVPAGVIAVWCMSYVQTAPAQEDPNVERLTAVYSAMRYHGAASALALAAGLVVRRMNRARPWMPKAVLAAVGLLAIGSMDRLVGVGFPRPSERDSIYEPHASRGWWHRRSVVGEGSGYQVHINRFGLRGPEISARKAEDEFRMLMLGDSITFGFTLPPEECFVGQLDALLRKRRGGPRVTLLNSGVCGYTTWQERDYLEKDGLALSPDLVILQFCINDVVDLIHVKLGEIHGWHKEFDFSNQDHWSGLVRAVLSIYDQRIAKATAARQLWANANPFDGTDPLLKTRDDLYREPPPPSVAAAWQRCLEELTRTDEVCRRNHLPWVLVWFPLDKQVIPGGESIRPQERLRAWADSCGVPFVDLTSPFRAAVAHAGGSHFLLLNDEVHPNTEASRIAAEEILRFLDERRLLDERQLLTGQAPASAQ